MCGLKLQAGINPAFAYGVTPFVGVWIETVDHEPHRYVSYVTPFVGVWIET